MEYLVLIVLVAGFALVYFKKNEKNTPLENDFLLSLNENLRKEIQEIRKEISQNSDQGRREIEEKLLVINKGINSFQTSSKEDMQKQLASSNKVIKEVTTELQKIKGTNEQVLGFANQMKTLEKILSNQKQRGILGEIQLENLLANVLPPELFQMEYHFNNGEAVDAIVKVGNFIIPIDAKFSLDNYNRMIESEDKTEIDLLERTFKDDIKKRIDETSKYIRTTEKTTDYAYMFIPADGLYQDLLNSRVGSLKINSKDLVSYAYTKKVMIVSPMSLFPMLQITVKALHNMKVERSIDEIMTNIDKLSNHLNAYKDVHESLGKTIRTVVNHFNKSSKEFNKIDKDITKISGGRSSIQFKENTIDNHTLMNKRSESRIFGIHAIIEAIESGKTIEKLFIQKGLHNDSFAVLWKLIRLKRINYKHVPLEKINRLTKKNHQGVFAFISPIDFYNIEDIIPTLYEEGKTPLILVLDRITDIRNFGAIARTAECAGVNAILIPEQNAAAINADAIKTSAGALHKITVCRTWNLKLALQFIKDSGIQLIACTEKTQNIMHTADYTSPTAIIMGSEEDGISQEFLKMSDAKVKIPMKGKISSLNVSVAAGIIIYEAIRQRADYK